MPAHVPIRFVTLAEKRFYMNPSLQIARTVSMFLIGYLHS
jgi:hypothetical protein